MKKKPRILVFIGHYLPGFKSGGPLKTIKNMVEYLGDDFEFLIYTRDRDLKENKPYPNVPKNQWIPLGKAKIFYASPEEISIRKISLLISSTAHELIYINSFFDPNFSIKPLLATKIINHKKPVILAPRGEFSSGALKIKKTKKLLFITASKLLKIHSKITFQASSSHEAKDIKKTLNASCEKIKIAIDLPEKATTTPEPATTSPSQYLKLVFLSRISPMKNLKFALEVLKQTRQEICFDIYGPLEDKPYWESCKKEISRLPQNVSANYRGAVSPSEVISTLAKYDLFFLPTLGENYGHVIAESLSSGTPVLISDQTPWRNLAADGLGWEIPLNNPKSFSDKIDYFAQLPSSSDLKNKKFTQERAQKIIISDEAISANKELFQSQIH